MYEILYLRQQKKHNLNTIFDYFCSNIANTKRVFYLTDTTMSICDN